MSSRAPSIDFRSLAKSALQDAALRSALRKATDTTNQKRVNAFESVEERQQLRETASSIRRDVINNFSSYVDQFSRNATHAGAIVHRAHDAQAAKIIIADILRDRGVKRVVKSKSMVSEEIELNSHLDRRNIHVIETDLGEYIVQLAGEKPSHITAPAIHKSRQQIGKLFSEQLGFEYSDDPLVLTALASKVLRREFFEAQAGITGANFALAESGSLVLFTNEGNGRMVTTLPPLHIAVLSLEKVIPSLDQLPVFMALLPRSATGQPLTSYVSIITGKRKSGEVSGSDEIHIVLLDNGRSDIAASDYSDILKCIRCGACMNVCPVYGVVGGHCYGATYGGPMGIILTVLLEGMERSHSLTDASTLCGACVDVCPVKVPLVKLISKLRERKASSRFSSAMEQHGMAAFGLASASPMLYRFGQRLLGTGWSMLTKVVGQGSSLESLPKPDQTPFRRRLR
jgi:L-lactate dehydrogenase complex protein LldF